MDGVAHALRQIADLLIRPVEGFGPVITVFWISAITGVAILGVIRWTTPQRLIERARGQIAASIYEVRLFLDSPLRVIKAQGRLLKNSALYIGALLPALVVMSLPMGLIYLQLDLRYGFQPIPVGEPAVVRVGLSGDPGDVSADPGDWGEITAPAVRDRDGGAVYLRLVVREPGTHALEVRAGDEVTGKRIVAEPGVAASPIRSRGAAMWWVPTAEPPLGGPRIQAIEIDQRTRSIDVLAMPWWLAWLLLSTAAALALRKPLGVEL